MKVSSSPLGRLATGFRPWALELTADAIRVSRGAAAAISVPLADVRSIAVKQGLLGAAISLTTSKATSRYWGLRGEEADRFVSSALPAIRQRALGRYEEHLEGLQGWNAALDKLLAEPRYVSNFDLETWRRSGRGDLLSVLESATAFVSNPMFRDDGRYVETKRIVARLTEITAGSRQEIDARNAKFVDAELRKHRTLFDSIEITPLTQEQRVAAIVLQDRNLLVAAAGSGKTSTIVAKAGYALLTKQYQPSEILVLAFNNDAAQELDERINKRLASLLPANSKVRCSTFHALGLAVIANGRGVKPSVAAVATGSEAAASRFIEKLVDDLLRSDMTFAVNWLIFRTLYAVPAKPIETFQSRREWDDYVRAVGDYKNDRRGFLTLKGDLVKSQGELAIANWLFAQGVPYEYEKPYEHPTATERYRQYSPDFYFPDIGAYPRRRIPRHLPGSRQTSKRPFEASTGVQVLCRR